MPNQLLVIEHTGLLMKLLFFFVSLYANSGSPTRYCVGLAGDLNPQQIRAHRLTVRTTGFHPVNVGSTPAGRANSDVAQLVEPLAVNQLVARSSRAIRAKLNFDRPKPLCFGENRHRLCGGQSADELDRQFRQHPTIAECSRGSFPVS